MRFIGLILLSFCLSSCSSSQQATSHYLNIELNLPVPLYTQGQGIPDPEQIFALPESAKALLDNEFKFYRNDSFERLREFKSWMGQPDGFRVLYDNETTYMAADTFAQGAGNCMSLAILAAAFSQYLDLNVDFLEPDVPLFWERRENIETINEHINVRVHTTEANKISFTHQGFLIDFSISRSNKRISSKKISKQEVVSLFYRNRAAEALAQGELDLAYSYGYQVMTMLPEQAGSYSLLGVILRQQGQGELAEKVYLKGLQFDQAHSFLLHNLVYLYRTTGQEQQAAPYQARLERLQMESPFVIAKKADELYELGRYEKALSLYKRAIRKADYIHDFHFGKARSLFSMGEYKAAERALTKAKELSTTLRQGSRYSNKLAALQPYL